MSRNKGILAALLTGVVFLTACQSGQQQEAVISETLITPSAANYKTVEVEVGDYEKTGQCGALLYFPLTEDIKLEADNARFKETKVVIDSKVKKGDVLAVFETDDMEVELEELKLSLQRAKEQLEEGKANRKTAISKATEDLEDVRGNHQLRIAEIRIQEQWIDYEQFVYESEKEIERLEEELADLQENLQECTLTAPFDGIIKNVEVFREGEVVNAGTVVISMYSLDTVYIKTDDAPQNPRYNTQVTMETGTKKNKISVSGHVVSSTNVLPYDAKQDYALISIDDDIDIEGLIEKYGNIRGQRIMCYYQLEELQNILLADKRAVDKENSSSYVYILDGDTVQKRFVVTDRSGSDNKIWILDGLSEGQQLILN